MCCEGACVVPACCCWPARRTAAAAAARCPLRSVVAATQIYRGGRFTPRARFQPATSKRVVHAARRCAGTQEHDFRACICATRSVRADPKFLPLGPPPRDDAGLELSLVVSRCSWRRFVDGPASGLQAGGLARGWLRQNVSPWAAESLRLPCLPWRLPLVVGAISTWRRVDGAPLPPRQRTG
jgi:hypothetical protein